MPNSAETTATLRAIRWFTITHGITMGVFVLLVATFFLLAGAGDPASTDGLFDHPLQYAVAGLSIAMLVALVALGRHARRRLSAELERDRLFTLSPDPLCVLANDGTLIRGNPEFERFFAPERAAANIIERAHPDDQASVASAIARVTQPGNVSTSFEARFRPAADSPGRNSRWRWLDWSVRRDPNSQSMLYAIARDTTSRREAEAALASEGAFRRAMEDSLLTGMRAFDRSGRITYVNKAFCDMVGLSESELVGATAPFSYWPDGDEALQMAQFDRVLDGAAPRSGIEVKLRRKDGSTLDAKMYVSPLIDQNGQHSGWMTSVTDITEPLRIREALAAAHERFTTVLEELDAAVSVLATHGEQSRDGADAGHELLFANRMYRQLFGMTGEGHLMLSRSSADSGSDEVLHAGLSRWFELRARDIRWVDGRPVQLQVATDITARREADEQFRRQELKLQHTSRLVTMGEMASSLAHELNQPLTAIANYCSGLMARIRSLQNQGQSADPGLLLEALQKTSDQAERAGEVIRRIRNFVQRSEAERRDCKVSDITAEAIGLAQIDAKRHRVRIQIEVAKDLPPLLADPILMQQVLLNLLKNAVEAMRDLPQGVARIAVLRVRRVADSVEFSVTDRGPGIRDDVQARLFEPFFTTKAEGMGIGLNICRSIVESHQGRLWAEHPDEGGSRFRFTIPVAEGVTLSAAA